MKHTKSVKIHNFNLFRDEIWIRKLVGRKSGPKLEINSIQISLAAWAHFSFGKIYTFKVDEKCHFSSNTWFFYFFPNEKNSLVLSLSISPFHCACSFIVTNVEGHEFDSSVGFLCWNLIMEERKKNKASKLRQKLHSANDMLFVRSFYFGSTSKLIKWQLIHQKFVCMNFNGWYHTFFLSIEKKNEVSLKNGEL